MNSVTIHQKKMCMSEMSVRHSSLGASRFFDTGIGSSCSSFLYVVKGDLHISSAKTSLDLQAGQMLYIPEGTYYTAVWKGNPAIEFYSIDVFSNSYDSAIAASSFALQRIDALSTTDSLDTMKEIFSLLGCEDKVSKLRAIAKYYNFYADAYPLLKQTDSEKFSPVLIKALQFIEEHFKEDFSIFDIAAHCYISESRLHHLFTSKLDTTPLKYRNNLRIEHASHALRSTSFSLDRIASSCGFNSTAYFRETFKQVTGYTPGQYRKLFLSGTNILSEYKTS